MGQPTVKAINLLRRSKGRADLVESAVRFHLACRDCEGAGGVPLHPDAPCPGCGFTFADSYGVEAVVEEIERKRKR